MRNLLSRESLLQSAVVLLVIILSVYRPGNSHQQRQVSISIGEQRSPENIRPAITLDGFVLRPGADIKRNKEFFVPVSRSGYQWLQALQFILLIGVCLIGIRLLIRIPFRVLYNIARGKPFAERNVRDLSLIGKGIIIIVLAMLVLPLLVRMILASSVPPDVYYPFWNLLYDSRWWLFAGLALLLIARAFRQGYDLQKENTSTV